MTVFHFTKCRLWAWILILISFFVLVVSFAGIWSNRPFLDGIDATINVMVAENIGSSLTTIAYYTSWVADSYILLLLGITIGILFLVKKDTQSAIIMIGSVCSTALFLKIFKELFLRTRPENAFELLSSFSFPSGHAGMVTAFFVPVIFIICAMTISRPAKLAGVIVGVLLIVLVGLSRIILNVHWFSDVIAGWALGTFLSTIIMLLVVTFPSWKRESRYQANPK